MKFDERVRKSGFKLINPVKHKKGDILLAERYNPEEKMWEMLWAIKRGAEDIGRTVFFKPNESRYVRILATQKDAISWLATNIEAGRYA